MNLQSPVAKRMLALSTGALVAVFPLLIIRLLIVAGLEGMQLPVSGWVKLFYLPVEIIFPSLMAALLLRSNPVTSSLGLATRVTGASLLLVPFLITLFALSIYTQTQSEQGFLNTLGIIVGLSPVLGVLGMVGFVLLCFPIITIGWGMAWFLDALVCRKHAKALKWQAYSVQSKCYSPGFRDRWRIKVGHRLTFLKVDKAERHQLAKLKVEFSQVREPLVQQLSKLVRSEGQALAAESGFTETIYQQQVDVERRIYQFHQLLIKKLRIQELTYQRYSSAVMGIYRSFINNLHVVAEFLITRPCVSDFRLLDVRLNANREVLALLDKLVSEIAQLPDLDQSRQGDLNDQIDHLKRLVAQVGDYK